MLFVRLASATYRLGAQLDKAIVELPHSPVEAAPINSEALRVRSTYLGYELSPRPNAANRTPAREPATRRALLKAFQKDWALKGRSP
jgi:hypothetical protein